MAFARVLEAPPPTPAQRLTRAIGAALLALLLAPSLVSAQTIAGDWW